MSNSIMAKSGWNDSKKLFEKNDLSGFKPLALPEYVRGKVYYRDNNDGTMSLTGFATRDYPFSSSTWWDWIKPPTGYQFTGIESGIISNNTIYDNAVETMGIGIFGMRVDPDCIRLMAEGNTSTHASTSGSETLILVPSVLAGVDAFYSGADLRQDTRNYVNVMYKRN